MARKEFVEKSANGSVCNRLEVYINKNAKLIAIIGAALLISDFMRSLYFAIDEIRLWLGTNDFSGLPIVGDICNIAAGLVGLVGALMFFGWAFWLGNDYQNLRKQNNRIIVVFVLIIFSHLLHAVHDIYYLNHSLFPVEQLQVIITDMVFAIVFLVATCFSIGSKGQVKEKRIISILVAVFLIVIMILNVKRSVTLGFYSASYVLKLLYSSLGNMFLVITSFFVNVEIEDDDTEDQEEVWGSAELADLAEKANLVDTPEKIRVSYEVNACKIIGILSIVGAYTSPVSGLVLGLVGIAESTTNSVLKEIEYERRSIRNVSIIGAASAVAMMFVTLYFGAR